MQSLIMNRKLGRFLKEAREAKGLSQRQLAKSVGIAFSSISRMEKGEFGSPDPAKLQRIAAVLDIDLEDIYAMAGYLVPKGLPEFGPYLRAKYELPETAVKELHKYFETLQDRYGEGGKSKRKRGGRA